MWEGETNTIYLIEDFIKQGTEMKPDFVVSVSLRTETMMDTNTTNVQV